MQPASMRPPRKAGGNLIVETLEVPGPAVLVASMRPPANSGGGTVLSPHVVVSLDRALLQ